MKLLSAALAIGAAALIGSAAYAAEPAAKRTANTEVASADTDMSSHRRRYRVKRIIRQSYYGPSYDSYAYSPAPYYGGPAYYGGGPGVSFSFGAGPRWGHHGWGGHHHW